MRRAVALTTLVVLVAGCSSGGGGEGGESGKKGDGPEPRATTTLIDNLYDRVDAGDWTLAEGLVATLEYLNSERKLRDVVPSGELIDFEGTAIIEAARGYLDDDRGAEQDRIRELVGDLLPTPEELRELAGETSAATFGPPDFECSDVWRHPRGPPAGTRCLGVETLDLPGGTTGRVYAPVEGLEPDEAASYQALVREALPAAWGVFSRFGAMPDVDVVFDPRGGGYTSAMAGMAFAEGICVMVVFPRLLPPDETPEDARFILAHEAFGCFLQFTIGSASSAEEEQWWKQGSEVYFANVVYPNANTEYGWLDYLRGYEPNHSLLELSYEAFPFFQHLGNTIGDPEVIAFVLGLARGANPADWPDMAALFHGYAEAFLTDRIMDSSRSPIPIPIGAAARNRGRHRPTRPGRVFALPTRPFVIERAIVDWEEQREYDIDLQQPDGTRISAQEHPAGAWASLADPVRACDAPLTQRVVMTRVTPGGDTVRLNVVNVEDVAQCDVRIVVHGAIEAEFVGGVCWVEGGFLMVTAGYGVFVPEEVEQIGPYPRGYALILGRAEPGTEPAGFPGVSISDGDRLTPLGSSASLTKSANLLTGSFTSDDISGEYSCPELTPPEVVRAA
ncbi:MAG: hypothetical protein ACT4PI_06740 [Actinomycetota bacterium]